MKLLSIDELKPQKGIPYSRAHIYRLIKADAFVKPIRLSPARIAFLESDIDDWIRSRAEVAA